MREDGNWGCFYISVGLWSTGSAREEGERRERFIFLMQLKGDWVQGVIFRGLWSGVIFGIY